MKKLFIALAVCLIAAPALAADPAKIKQEQQWIETAKEQAKDICRDNKISGQEKSKKICDLYGICSPESCFRAIKTWYNDATQQLKTNPDQYFYNVERVNRR